MHVLIVQNTVIPAKDYGGTERIVWWLAKELVRAGHEVSFLVPQGSSCPFAKTVLVYDPSAPLQIPDDVDLVHFNFQINTPVKKPYVITHHGNDFPDAFDINTIFVSSNHAKRNGSSSYVLNGIDPDEYGHVDFEQKRKHLLFLAYAKRPEKNLKDCVHIAYHAKELLAVGGGKRRFDRNGWAWWVRYYGMINGELKNRILGASKALLFPVLWHEPFGIAVAEAMYFGCPVFGTTYGSLPELVTPETGLLSNSRQNLIEAVRRTGEYDPRKIHQYACAHLNSRRMAGEYLKKYEIVLNGGTLNPTAPVRINQMSERTLLPMEP